MSVREWQSLRILRMFVLTKIEWKLVFPKKNSHV